MNSTYIQVKEQRCGNSDSGDNLINTDASAFGNFSILSNAISIDPFKRELIIRNFVTQCGVAMEKNTNSQVLNIQQELARMASLQKREYKSCAAFWQLHEHSIPLLALLTRKYLSISASSVSRESVFSISNHVIRKNRVALTSKNIRYNNFLKDKLN